MLGLDEPVKLIANVVTITLWAAALVDIVRSPRADWYNPRGKVLTAILVAGPSIFLRGVFLPVAPAVWFAWWRRAGGLGHLPSAERP